MGKRDQAEGQSEVSLLGESCEFTPFHDKDLGVVRGTEVCLTD